MHLICPYLGLKLFLGTEIFICQGKKVKNHQATTNKTSLWNITSSPDYEIKNGSELMNDILVILIKFSD